MDYRVLNTRTGEMLDTLELHVLARAYHAAWRAVHDATPEGWHQLPALSVLIDFDWPAGTTRRH